MKVALTLMRKKLTKTACLLGFMSCFWINGVFAKNLGVQGAIYSIAEPDLLAAIYQKLTFLQKSGALAHAQQAVMARVKQHLLRPTPVLGVDDIAKGTVTQQYAFDPSIVLQTDIVDAGGRVIAKRGTRINPLAYRRFDEQLLFIKGENARELAWAKKMLATVAPQKKIKIILVSGDIAAATQKLEHRIYFDQRGALCQRFHIRRTPTRLFQKTGSETLTARRGGP